MTPIFQISGSDYWTGVSEEIEDYEGAPPGWTRCVPPSADEGEYVRWAAGRWSLTNIPPPAEPTEEEIRQALLEDAKDEMRVLRAPMLNALMGMHSIATRSGDTETADKAEEVRLALLDITHDPDLNAAHTWEEMKIAAKLAYRRVAALVTTSPQFAAVFREVTGA